jgi:hypothetical protein
LQEILILLMGSDAEGKVFSEKTKTVVVSQHGAGIVSYHNLTAEQELVLRIKGTAREAAVRVVGEIAQQGGQHTYGVSFVEDRGDYWQMEFPPASAWQEERPAVPTLESAGCGGVVNVMNGDFEFDVCAIHGGLARFCDQCGQIPYRYTMASGVRPRHPFSPKTANRVLRDYDQHLRELESSTGGDTEPFKYGGSGAGDE